MTPPLPEVLAAVELPEPDAWMLCRKRDGFIRGCYSERPSPEQHECAAIDGDEYRPLHHADQLRAYGEACRTLKPGSEWVSVGERLPEEGFISHGMGVVAVWHPEYAPDCGHGQTITNTEYLRKHAHEFTHWQFLQPPARGGES